MQLPRGWSQHPWDMCERKGDQKEFFYLPCKAECCILVLCIGQGCLKAYINLEIFGTASDRCHHLTTTTYTCADSMLVEIERC